MKMAQKKVPKNPEWHKPAGAGSWFPACQRGWHMPGGRITMPFNHSPSLCGAAIYPCLVRDSFFLGWSSLVEEKDCSAKAFWQLSLQNPSAALVAQGDPGPPSPLAKRWKGRGQV